MTNKVLKIMDFEDLIDSQYEARCIVRKARRKQAVKRAINTLLVVILIACIVVLAVVVRK